MDPRTAAHVLSEIASLLELRGENRFKTRAYRAAAQAILSLDTDDLGPIYRSGELAGVPGLGPATLGVVRDLVETGESEYLMQLREHTPEGLLEMLRVPGLGVSKIQAIYEGLGIGTLHELEEAAQDGRLTKLPRFGPKTADKILKGIAFLRESGSLVLYHRAAAEAGRLVASIRRHPEVVRAEVAGSVRRRREVIRDVDIVAACTTSPEHIAASFARLPGVREVIGVGGRSVRIRYVDGTLLDLHCVEPGEFAVALWRATGSDEHVVEVGRVAATRGLTIRGDRMLDIEARPVPLEEEANVYAALGLDFIPPELREGSGEVEAAMAHALPHLVELTDIRGVLHCHSRYSDGKATIAEMADAARSRGWSYLGISDHSQSAFYANGLSRDAILRQHDEIEQVNASLDGFRVLKGIEADILADGRVDYDDEVLDRFDFVIASVHARFGMTREQMTTRVLRALEDPHVTILGHPTGRLLLNREPYPIDMDAVIDKATEMGVALELNADPHRLDMDWRLCRMAKARGARIAIGPDAHSTRSLDNVEVGVGIARKGWLEADDVVNTRSADDVVGAARRRREAAGAGIGAGRSPIGFPPRGNRGD